MRTWAVGIPCFVVGFVAVSAAWRTQADAKTVATPVPEPACLSERAAAIDADRKLESFDPSIAPKLLPPNESGDALMVPLEQNAAGQWVDVPTLVHLTEMSDTPWKASRPATFGDAAQFELRKELSAARAALSKCVYADCADERAAKADAKRLHGLHSSDSTARGLVDAEKRYDSCMAAANASHVSS